MPRTRSIAWSELKLGVVAIAALVLATIMIVALGGQGGFWWQRYPLKMQFNDAQGLKSGAVVRLSGKDVGTVTSVEFFDGRIDVIVEISQDVRPFVTSDSIGKVGSISLLGESIIDLSAARTGTPLADWQYIPTVEHGTVGDLTTTASEILTQVSQLFADARSGRGTLGRLITDEGLYRELEQFVKSASTVTRNLNSGKGTIGSLMQDPAAYQAMKASLENLQTMTQRINQGQGALGRFLNDEAMAKSLSGTLTNLEQTTARLNRSDSTLGKLTTERELYDRLNSMSARLDEVAGGLQQGTGTVGQLLRDRQLYENMNRAVTEIQALVADIRKDPKKYLRVSVSIF